MNQNCIKKIYYIVGVLLFSGCVSNSHKSLDNSFIPLSTNVPVSYKLKNSHECLDESILVIKLLSSEQKKELGQLILKCRFFMNEQNFIYIENIKFLYIPKCTKSFRNPKIVMKEYEYEYDDESVSTKVHEFRKSLFHKFVSGKTFTVKFPEGKIIKIVIGCRNFGAHTVISIDEGNKDYHLYYPPTKLFDPDNGFIIFSEYDN